MTEWHSGITDRGKMTRTEEETEERRIKMAERRDDIAVFITIEST